MSAIARPAPVGGAGRWLQTAVLVLAASLGCDRNVEPFEPGEQPETPDLARIFPGPSAGAGMPTEAAVAAEGSDPGRAAGASRGAFPPSRTEGAGALAQGGEPTGRGPGRAASTPDSAAGAASPISGRIELAPELAGQAPPGAVLFVIARPQGATSGPPLAVRRIPDPVFPVEFEIGPGDVMIPTLQFVGPITLSARLDADGNAMTRGETDLSGTPVESLSPGASGITLVLGRKG